jgi:hypothetical protein
MTIIDDVLAQATGAHLFRSDLHIHSFGASHDVRGDTAIASAAIVATAEPEGLAIISITDHNETMATEAALQAAKSAAVHVTRFFMPVSRSARSEVEARCFGLVGSSQ